MDHFDELTWHLISLLEIENFDQVLGEYFQFIVNLSSHHLFLRVIHLVQTHFFRVLFLCINKVIIFMGMFHMVDMVIGVIKSDWVKFWTRACNCYLRNSWVFGFIIFLLKSFEIDPCLWFFLRSCSLGAFACMYNGPIKGGFSSVQSCCINSYITPLLLIPHPRQFSFRYWIEDVLGMWKDLVWYCLLWFLCWCYWPVFLSWYCCLVLLLWYCLLAFLLVCWRWFDTFWWWNLFPKFLLTMGSIIEWDLFISNSDVSRVSKIFSIEGVNVIDSSLLCVLHSNLLKYSSK